MTTDRNIKKYLDPKMGYWGKTKMLKKFKGKDGSVLRNMYALQRHREVNNKIKRKLYRHETSPRPFYSVQVDLAFLPKLKSPLNNNIWGFMVVIDLFSRYMWVKTFTTRESLHIPLESVLGQMRTQFGKTPENMTGDNEFATTRLQALAGRYNFKWWYGDAHEKFRTGVVERSIRTIKNLVKRYVVQNNTTRYIDVLNDLVANYNNTIHRTIGTTPYKAITTLQRNIVRERKTIPPLEEGQRVRVLQDRSVLTKGDKPYYSKEVYKVVGRDRNRYIVGKVDSDVVLRKRYGRHQLYKVGKNIIEDRYVQKAKKLKDRLGYDEGVRRNAVRNALSKELHKSGIKNLNEYEDPIEKQEAVLHEYSIESEKDIDEERIDDIDEQWDKLSSDSWVVLPTNENGACFFNAIAGLLHWEKGHTIIKPGSSEEKRMASFLRKQIIKYMKRHRNKKIPVIDETFEENITRQLKHENDDRSLDQYLTDMLKTSEWAGQSEIIASSLYLKRNILVYVKRDKYFIKHGGYIYDDSVNKFLTLFWNQKNPYTEGNHYEYLLRGVKKPRRSKRLAKKHNGLEKIKKYEHNKPTTEIDILREKIRKKQLLSDKYVIQNKLELFIKMDEEIERLQEKLKKLEAQTVRNTQQNSNNNQINLTNSKKQIKITKTSKDGNQNENVEPNFTKPRRNKQLKNKPRKSSTSEIDILREKIRKKQLLSDKYVIQNKLELFIKMDEEIERLQEKLENLENK